jgi:hypothetical protein
MRITTLGVAIGLAAAGAASAHHSPAMLYDLSKEVTVEGTVTEFLLGNPHLRLYFDVQANGTTEKWIAEGGSRTVLMRKGWTENQVKPGDKIAVRGHPARDGSHLVHMEYLTLPGGKQVYSEDFDANAVPRRTRAAGDQPE